MAQSRSKPRMRSQSVTADSKAASSTRAASRVVVDDVVAERGRGDRAPLEQLGGRGQRRRHARRVGGVGVAGDRRLERQLLVDAVQPGGDAARPPRGRGSRRRPAPGVSTRTDGRGRRPAARTCGCRGPTPPRSGRSSRGRSACTSSRSGRSTASARAGTPAGRRGSGPSGVRTVGAVAREHRLVRRRRAGSTWTWHELPSRSSNLAMNVRLIPPGRRSPWRRSCRRVVVARGERVGVAEGDLVLPEVALALGRLDGHARRVISLRMRRSSGSSGRCRGASSRRCRGWPA